MKRKAAYGLHDSVADLEGADDVRIFLSREVQLRLQLRSQNSERIARLIVDNGAEAYHRNDPPTKSFNFHKSACAPRHGFSLYALKSELGGLSRRGNHKHDGRLQRSCEGETKVKGPRFARKSR